MVDFPFNSRPPLQPFALSIVLPCLNEAANVQRVVKLAAEAARRVAATWEVIVVNDGSQDDTGSLADQVAREIPNVRVIHHERNLGYGAAVASGLRAAKCDWVFYTDGDGQFDLAQLDTSIDLLRTHDAVAGYRIGRQEGLVRRFNGWMWTKLMNIVFGLRSRDVDCAFKLFPRSFTQDIDLHCTGALISAELLCQARLRGLKVAEMGVRHLPRIAGKSTGGNPAVILRAFREMFTLRNQILAGENAGRASRLGPAILVALLALLVFAPSVRNQFTGWDDTAYTIDNPHLKDAAGLARIWTTAESEQYYPLTFTAFWLQYQVFGTQPMGYHAVSIALHAINATFVVILIQRLGLRCWPAALCGALFAVHPVQVMSVAWIAEQKNLLSCLFVLVYTLAWVSSSEGSRAKYALALICFALALLSKTAVLGMPVILAVLDRFALGKTWRAAALRALPMMLIAAASALVTIAFEQKFIESSDNVGIPPLAERVLLAAATPWWYLKQLALPFDLAPVYEIWNVSAARWIWWLPLTAWVMCAVLAFWLWRHSVSSSQPMPPMNFHQPRISNWLTWTAAWFFIMLGPVVGLVPYGNMHATFVSDHFLYIACIGSFAFLALLIQLAADLRAANRIAQVGCVLVVLALATISLRSIGIYHDADSLWTRAIERSPHNPVANLGLGVSLRNQGRMDEALARFRSVAKIRPELPDGHMFAAEVELNRGNLLAAERTLQAGLTVNPDSVPLLDMLATILGRTGRMTQAIQTLERAAMLDPRNVSLKEGLAEAYMVVGRRSDAEAVLRDLAQSAGTGPAR